jgi:hypothetical protein
MSKVVLSFSYNGTHIKAPIIYGRGKRLNPIEHMQMLIAAIDCINPDQKYEVIVSALNFDMWRMNSQEKQYAMEIYRKARFVFDHPSRPDHHQGAGISINMSLHGALILKADSMIHLAEDVIMEPESVDYFCEYLKDYDYVGTHLPLGKYLPDGKESDYLNTQVFGCRPKTFYSKKIVPINGEHLERGMCTNIKKNNLKYAVGNTPRLFPEEKLMYFHTHDVKLFKSSVEKKGVKWFFSSENKFL